MTKEQLKCLISTIFTSTLIVLTAIALFDGKHVLGLIFTVEAVIMSIVSDYYYRKNL